MNTTFTVQDDNAITFSIKDENGTAISIAGKTLNTGIALVKDPSNASSDWLILNNSKHTNLEDGDANLVGQYTLTTAEADVTSLNELKNPKAFTIVIDGSGNEETYWFTFPFEILKRPASV